MTWYLDLSIVLITVLYVIRCSWMNRKYESAVGQLSRHPSIGDLIKLAKRLVIFSCLLSLIFLGLNTWRAVMLFKDIGIWGISAIILLVYFNFYAGYQIGLYHWYHNLMRFARFKEIS